MIISITNLKGGVGKSTLAQNLAVALATRGHRLCIADTDVEQQTSGRWAAVRAEQGGGVVKIPVFQINPDTISDQILNKLAKNYDLVIVDGTPALTELTTRIIMMSDWVITPILASASDLWALDTFLKRFREARITKESMGGHVGLRVILNKYSDRANLDREIAEAVGGLEIEMLVTRLPVRVAYKEATVQGLGVTELRDKNARAEMEAVAIEVENLLKQR